jgi:hypothetical protein
MGTDINFAPPRRLFPETGTGEIGVCPLFSTSSSFSLLDGNPFDGFWNMLNTKVVLKGGVAMVDQR